VEYIDGPLLPHLHKFRIETDPSSQYDDLSNCNNNNDNSSSSYHCNSHKHERKNADDDVPQATTSLVSLLTPPIISSSGDGGASSNENNGSGGEGETQQYLLVPNPGEIVVRSMHHGRRVCVLRVGNDSDGDGMDFNQNYGDGGKGIIRAVTLAKLCNKDKEHQFDQIGEWVILAGCSDGTIREWTVRSLTHGNESVLPRRVWNAICPSVALHKQDGEKNKNVAGENDDNSDDDNDAMNDDKKRMKKKDKESKSADKKGYGNNTEKDRSRNGDDNDDACDNKEGGVNIKKKSNTSDSLDTISIVHLTCPTRMELDKANNEGARLYALVKGNQPGNNKHKSQWIVQCTIPPFPGNGNRDKSSDRTGKLTTKPMAPVKYISSKQSKDEKVMIQLQRRNVCLAKKDEVFGLVGAYRPIPSSEDEDDDMDCVVAGGRREGSNEYNSKRKKGKHKNKVNGEVFLVICFSKGFVIYRDPIYLHNSNLNTKPSPNRMVHFTREVQSTKHYDKQSSAYSSVAISPDVRDLALGRANGKIDVLDNVFDNVAEFLCRIGSSSSTSTLATAGVMEKKEVGKLKHPDVVTVRRTVHWHSHPVRALTFLIPPLSHSSSTAAIARNNNGVGSNPISKSLLSGGEESVLVTWQLDRNDHRPSHFVSRIAQGGIIHVACCPYSGKIVVSSLDNSIQCFSGSNYEKIWMEQGLASAPLHQEEEEGVVVKENGKVSAPVKGGIFLAKDPITHVPILGNLPGAPGMVHWYDPKSASVVGTLEVAPYNRVSRRDPINDPHIPAPAITHLAFGQNGRDLVTVDTSWTENTSVGCNYTLQGPTGSTTEMNMCTNIKFWTYVDAPQSSKVEQRKRRNGEMPMSYELVSSMVAPHGRNGQVYALAITPDGSTACTLSREEDAFRVWVKNTSYSLSAAKEMGSTLWKCLYRVRSPSGYANLLSGCELMGEGLVSFSSDGSVLSVAYGPYLTLWDHANATLLTSVSIDSDGAGASQDIRQVHFLTDSDDAILISTATQIGVKSPFGGGTNPCYLGQDEWSFDFGSMGKGVHVSAVVPLRDYGGLRGVFVLCISLGFGARSMISIVGREGKVVCADGTEGPLQWALQGEVQSLSVNKCNDTNVELLAITKDCRMFSLRCGPEMQKEQEAIVLEKKRTLQELLPRAPVLKIARDYTQSAKQSKRRKISVSSVPKGPRSARDFNSFEFPALSGKFTASFIAKNLGTKGN